MSRPYFLELRAKGSEPFLWRLVREVNWMTKQEWNAAIQRSHLLASGPLPRDYRSAARRRGVLVRHFLPPGQTVILLGADVARAVGHTGEWFEWVDGWAVIPAPHVRNPWYGVPGNGRTVGEFVCKVLRDCAAGGQDTV